MLYLILHLLNIAMSTRRTNLKGFRLGMAFLFFIYMGVNVSMTMGLAPVVGLPLPMFEGGGGTSFIIFAILFGILENLLAFSFLFYVYDRLQITHDERESPYPLRMS